MTTTTTTAQTVTYADDATREVHKALVSAANGFTKARETLTKALNNARKDDAWKGVKVDGQPFKAWPQYVAHVLSELPKLGKSDREILAAIMSGEGMSVRAIATALNTSPATAARDADKGHQRRNSEPSKRTTGNNGRVQSRGTGKGKGKGSKAQTSKAQTSKPSAEPHDNRKYRAANTRVLRDEALRIVEELSRRWQVDGDSDAESAVVDIAAMVNK